MSHFYPFAFFGQTQRLVRFCPENRVRVCPTHYRLHFVSSVLQLEAKLVEMDKSNTQLKLTVTNLNLRVRTGNKEMQREMQKVSTCHTKN